MRLAHLGVALGCILLAACERSPPTNTNDVAPTAAPATQSDQLTALVERYFDRFLALNPLLASAIGDGRFDDRFPNNLSEAWIADSLALEQDYLAELQKIDVTRLDANAKLTYEAFKYGREVAIEGFSFPSELLPINQFASLPLTFAQMGAGGNLQPFATTADYDHFLQRMMGFVTWVDQAIANLKAGADQGVVQPKVVIQRCIAQLSSIIVDDPQKSVFYRPIEQFATSVAPPDRERLKRAYFSAIRDQVLPAYRRLRDALQMQALPASRDSVGLSALPNGEKWYAYLAKINTTTTLTPNEIHEIGLKEMARIKAEMEKLRTQLAPEGDMAAFMEKMRNDPALKFSTPEEMLSAYGAVRERVTTALPMLFADIPPSNFDIRAVEAYRARSAASAYYMDGSPDGKRPGVFYVNTYDLPARPKYLVEAIFLHEADPGHHLQRTLQSALKQLPRFRRFASDTAYVEGWGLYAESLGRELGMYQDVQSQFGALTAEAWRAARLVVDTGLHAKGWSREQAIKYMRDNTALGNADINAEVERYIASPGQALAYKIGQLKIRELRTRSEQRLGAAFDVRQFHAQILNGGSLPLAVLETKVTAWLAAESARPADQRSASAPVGGGSL